jgi:hypothetical protein
MTLVSIKRAPRGSPKKYVATFSSGRRVSFGARGYSDYTMHHDEERKKRYLKRHSKNENWRNLESAGALSRYILWNKKSLKASIQDYKRRSKR